MADEERERERERENERKWVIIFFHHFAERIRQNFCRSSKKCPTVVIASFQQKSSLKKIVRVRVGDDREFCIFTAYPKLSECKHS